MKRQDKTRNRFVSVNQIERYRAERRGRRRKKGETVQSVYQDIRLLMALAFPSQSGEMYEIIACLVFNHLREHEDWSHHEPLIAIDICLPQLSTVVQLTTLSKM